MSDEHYEDRDALAVVGMDCRFPGANNVNAFWENLCNGIESVTFFTDEELMDNGVDAQLLSHPNYVKAHAALDDYDQFDAAFFSIPPREAEVMDPQHRIFLELAWSALEHAGYDCLTHESRIAVFAGAGPNAYLVRNLASNMSLVQTVGEFQTNIGNNKDFLPTRVSYKLNLTGPSVNVNTACSSSLVAVNLAGQSLLNYQCDMALAGGVTIHVPQREGYLYQADMIVSPDGHCRAFDENAAGIVGGSGAGVVVLKRLEDALADRDTIHALILGSAVNNDGANKVGYTAPSVEGQAKVIAEAQGIAEIDPDTVTYIEAHGTGTNLGDPIEFTALTRAFRLGTDQNGFCAIGSVKTNIGHLDTAAGVAGLIKTIMALKHRKLPPSLHYEKPNPKIDFENSPFYVNTTTRDWSAPDGEPRRAGVSSFGIGGSNAHVVLEEAPRRQIETAPASPRVLTLSAKTPAALEAAVSQLAAHLDADDETPLADIAFTLATGRHPFPHRAALVCESREAGAAGLRGETDGLLRQTVEVGNRDVVMMFSGQGAQYVNMARGLYQTQNVFRDVVDQLARGLKQRTGADLCQILFPPAGAEESAAQQLAQTQMTQPALFIVEYALAKLWLTLGVQPAAMIGHSIGEVTAACLAGVFSEEHALDLVVARGRLMSTLPSGAMLAVPLDEDKLKPYLNDNLSIAALNAPGRNVVSGTHQAVAELKERLSRVGVTGRDLHTSHAFHSAMMDPILARFENEVAKIKLNPPTLPFISNVTGTWITDEDAVNPNYWVKHLRCAVRFEDGIGALLTQPNRIFLEVGPGNTLCTLAAKHAAMTDHHVVLASTRHPRTRAEDEAHWLTTLGQLWVSGATIHWQAQFEDQECYRVPLPTYPFQRERYWVEPGSITYTETAKALPQKAADPADYFYQPSWERLQLPRTPSLGTPTHWLIFGGQDTLTQTLIQQLQTAGHTHDLVRGGDQFQTTPNGYTVNPLQPEDYIALMDHQYRRTTPPTRVIHLWNVGETATLDDSFFSPLYLVQALGRQKQQDPLTLALVSTHLQDVTGLETLKPERAGLTGLIKSVPLEFPNLRCLSIDLDAVPDAEAASAVLAETLNQGDETMVARRGRFRWVQSYKPIRLEATQAPSSRFKEGGVYLITGGLGGIGLAVAEHLAHTVKARLMLTSRSPFPQPAQWDTHVAEQGPTDPISLKIAKLRTLQSAGATISIHTVDVTDLNAMRRAVDQAEQSLGPVQGVIHAAGVPGGGLVQLKTREDAEKVFAPKIAGTQVLDQLFQDADLDLMVLCSSVNAPLGGVGQVDYCSANAYLDAYAHARSAQMRGTVSINFDSWAQIGMAASAAHGPDGPPTADRPVDHPLLDHYRAETADQEVFTIDFKVDKHWPLSEHRVFQKATLPGTTWLEIIRAAFDARPDGLEGKTLQLRNVYFLNPMIVGDDEEREARLLLKKRGSDFEFAVFSTPQDDGWQQHARGEAVLLPSAAAKSNPIADLEAACSKRRIDVDAGDEKPAGNFIDAQFGIRWESFKRIDLGEGQGLAVLELPQPVAEDPATYKLHPAMLDTAIHVLAFGVKDEGSYLPFSYKSITLHGDLPRRIYSHIRYLDNTNKTNLEFDITLMDPNGRVLVEIERYSLRKLNVESFHAAPTTKPFPAMTATIGSGWKLASKTESAVVLERLGLTPAEGVEALNRALDSGLSQVIVSTHDFNERLLNHNVISDPFSPQHTTDSTPKAKHKRPNLSTPYVAPTTDTETKVATIWQNLLGIEDVGIRDNFFELGGDSLSAIQVMTQIRDQYNVDLPLGSLFDGPDVAGLSGRVDKAVAADETGTGTALAEVLPTAVHQAEHVHDPFPMTDIQQAYWMGRGSLFELGNIACHAYFEIDGYHLNTDGLEKAWQRLVDRHDMLRAVVLPTGEQQILESVPAYQMEVLDLRGEDPQSREAQILAIREDMSHHVFSGEEWPLFGLRATLIDDQTTRIHVSYDLLIGDLASLAMLFYEWSICYYHPERELPRPAVNFRDYVLAEKALEHTELFKRAEDYWYSRIPQLPPGPDLPLAVNPRAIDKPRFRRHASTLDEASWTRLKQKAAKAGVTHSGILLAAYAEVLTAWSKTPRFTINMTLFNRLPLHEAVNDIIGDFTSVTLLTVDNSQSDLFADRAVRLQKQLWNDLDHRFVSGVRVLREMARRQGGSQVAAMPVVFTSALALGSFDAGVPKEEQVGDTVYGITQTSQVWLDHQVFEAKGELVFHWDSVDGLFPEGMLDDMFQAYCTLLRELADTDETWRVTSRDLLPAGQARVRDEVNATKAPVSDQYLHTLFAEQAAAAPDRPAVIAGDQTFTYRRIDVLARTLGAQIRDLGAKPNQLVAVVMDKGWEMAPACLGIQMAGAAYVPLSPTLPDERLNYLFDVGQIKIALTQSWLEDQISWPQGLTRIVVDRLEPTDNPPALEPVQKTTDIAYVIYTSGSTGLPKGVVIDHRGAVNTCLDINHRFQVTPNDRVLAVSALNFDLSVYDLFGMFAAGGAVVFPESQRRVDPDHWVDLCNRHQVTLWNTVPALMQMFADILTGRRERTPQSLRLAMLSGDWIPMGLYDQINALWNNLKLISLGGATEASIWSILYPVQDVNPAWKSIPYGKPMVNQTFHVLDSHMRPCPDWVPGMLYIGGTGLALGYWGDKEKTDAAFVTNPHTGERLYKTGDLGRYFPDGNIEFLGREDFQVKINGFRVELGEIEQALIHHPAVADAVVAAVGEVRGSLSLAAYIILDQSQPGQPTPEQLSQYLSQKLPDYMVPPAYLFLDRFPLTANGKVDRKALPKPDAPALLQAVEFVEPRNETESNVAQIIAQLLGIERVSVTGNFFEMGGDSVMATRFISKLRETFGMEIPLLWLFEKPTAADLAERIQSVSMAVEDEGSDQDMVDLEELEI